MIAACSFALKPKLHLFDLLWICCTTVLYNKSTANRTIVVTVRPTNEKSLSDSAELALMHKTLCAVADIMGVFCRLLLLEL